MFAFMNLHFARGSARAILLAALSTVACTVAIHAQTLETETAATPTPPYSLFEYSVLTGTGNTITATWLPVITSTGQTIYENVTLQFDVDSKGNLTISPGYPQVIQSPPSLTSSFRAGKYLGPNAYCPSSQATVNVSGPGIAPGGATEWSLAVANTCAETYPSSATWYVGPIANNPWASRLKAAGITSTAWSYGIGTGYNFNGHWAPGTLIGVSQTGNAITFVSFTASGADHNTPVDQITYILSQ
jgi:hypothetical protein